ncbi:hypothetical protein O6H91_08G118700 [Diphasiastrum complanatum]|uniref:Uncharacterized protein n=1 Tax=Diphasiastrum complanatum TaxID=34168 RepID=A0ACC2D1K3_DIPCM|nr:hypothetical protein O6H91_08G118700 [Diphasiastrum complanatum]
MDFCIDTHGFWILHAFCRSASRVYKIFAMPRSFLQEGLGVRSFFEKNLQESPQQARRMNSHKHRAPIFIYFWGQVPGGILIAIQCVALYFLTLFHHCPMV